MAEVVSFKEAFRKAKNQGKKTFTWKGNKYNTVTADEKKAAAKKKFGGKPKSARETAIKKDAKRKKESAREIAIRKDAKRKKESAREIAIRKDAKRKNKNVSREIAIKKDAKKTNKTPSKSYLANKKKKRISEMSLIEKISSLTTDEGYSFGDLRRAISALTRRN